MITSKIGKSCRWCYLTVAEIFKITFTIYNDFDEISIENKKLGQGKLILFVLSTFTSIEIPNSMCPMVRHLRDILTQLNWISSCRFSSARFWECALPKFWSGGVWHCVLFSTPCAAWPKKFLWRCEKSFIIFTASFQAHWADNLHTKFMHIGRNWFWFVHTLGKSFFS